MAALGAIGVVLVGWARGSVGAQQLAGGGGTNAFLLLVPALIVFAAAIVSARLLAPALRALGRAGRRGPVALRLAAASLARNPGPRRGRRDVPGREPRARAVRGRLPLDARRRASATRRRSRSPRRTSSPRTSTSSSRCRTARSTCSGRRRRSYGCPATSRRGRRSASSRCRGTSIANVGGWRGDFATKTRAQLAAAVAPEATPLRRVDASARPAAHAAGDGDGRRHRRARVLPLGARRLRRRRARPHARRRTR